MSTSTAYVFGNCYFLYSVTRVMSLYVAFNIKAQQKERLLLHTAIVSRSVSALF